MKIQLENMELQRKRKEKPRTKKPAARDCDFIIEETKRYSGEIYGKQFEDDVCTEHSYHNHVLKIRNKDEISSEIEDTIALEEIQRDYDDIADIGDTTGADNTRDSGFLSVKDIDDEPDLLAIDATAEEFGDFTIHTIRAEIESLTERMANDKTGDLNKQPENTNACHENIEEDNDVNTPTKEMGTSKAVNEFANFERPTVNGVKEESNVPFENENVEDTAKRKQLITSKPDFDSMPQNSVSVDKAADNSWEIPKKRSSFGNWTSSVTKSRDIEEPHSKRLSLKSDTSSDINYSRPPSVIKRREKEEIPSRRQSLKSDYSDIKEEWSLLEPETIYNRDIVKRQYRHSSQISRRSLQENYEKTNYRKDSFTSATSFPISRSHSVASTSKSVATIIDSIGPRPKLRRSMSASFIHSVRSFKRSLRSSLRSLAGSLRSLATGDESSSKTKRRTQSLTSLRSEARSERKERQKFKRYSLESLSSRTFYDPSKSKLENDVAAFERRKKLMQGYSKQADYMEKCFDIRDRKDEPYRGSTLQYKECLTLCTKMDLELQRQKPLQEDENYKHIPYMDQV